MFFSISYSQGLTCQSWVFSNYRTKKTRFMFVRAFPGGATGREPACQCRTHERRRLDPWVKKIPWRRAWQPLQYSCLESPMDRGAWRAAVHKVAKSRTWLKRLSVHVAWLWTALSVLFEFSTLGEDSRQKQSPPGSCKPERVIGTWIISFHGLAYAQKCISSFLFL